MVKDLAFAQHLRTKETEFDQERIQTVATVAYATVRFFKDNFSRVYLGQNALRKYYLLIFAIFLKFSE